MISYNTPYQLIFCLSVKARDITTKYEDAKLYYYLDYPVRLPEVPELAEPVVYLVHLDADHVPEPGEVLTCRHKRILLPGHILKLLRHE